MKKILCLVMCLIMVLSTCVVAFGADKKCDCGEDPTIFVNGIGETIYTDIDNDVTLIPSSAGVYIKAILPNLFKLLFGAVFHKYDKFADGLIDAANKLIAGTGCDKDGNFPEGQCVDFEYPEVKKHGKGIKFGFTYDWRRSPCDIADDLDDYVDYICKETGHDKVKLIGFSMGSAVTLAYLSEYGHDKVSGVALFAGCQSGTSCCGEPFCLDMAYDADSTVRYMHDLFYGQSTSDLLSTLFAILYKIGLLDKVGNTLIDIIDEVGDRVYDEAVIGTFAATPGMFALIPDAKYEDAVNSIYGGKEDEYAGIIKKIEEYHNIQIHAVDIYDSLLEDGINFGIVSKYGLQHFAFMDSASNLSDTVIDTKYTSLGATCADICGELTAEQLALTAANGKAYISPDKMINAATCVYPEYTWFIRNCPHSNNCDDCYDLLYYILYADKQPTVNDNADYPQFMLYNPDSDELEILSDKNIPAIGKSLTEKNIFALNIDLFKAIFAAVKG